MIKALVVDDDFMVARLHSSVVAAQPGFELVGVANTGAAALQAVATQRPDLVLLDIYLPDITGLEVIQHLRQDPSSAAVDVIVISAAREVETLQSALRGGVFQYLVKPFQITELRDRLDEFAAHHRRLHALADVGQAEADQLFRGSATRTNAMPKGISPATNILVINALRDAPEGEMSATECAEALGLSRSSARRYLEFLVDSGDARVRHQYGSAGRPERRYRASDNG